MKQKASICLECGQLINPSAGKIPLFLRYELKPSYCHVGCYNGNARYYEVGHHNIIKESRSEYLYFWMGECGTAKSLELAEDALFELIRESGL